MSKDQDVAKQLEVFHKKLSSSLRTKLRPLFARFDLRPIDFAALGNIYFHPGITVMALCNKLGLSQSTISSMIKRYERINLVTKSVNPTDKRSYCLYVTDSAKSFVSDTLSPQVSHFFLELVADMSEEEKDGLMSALKSLNRILEENAYDDETG